MKFKKLSNWEKDFRNDGLLFFTQRIQEMLYYYTDHIYKCPVLNTHLLVVEYLETADLVRRNIIDKNHLKCIMEEFKETFSNDLIIQNNIDYEMRTQILQKLNSSSLSDQENIMRYILYLLKDYNLWCINYLKEIVPQEREKKKIDRALKCFIPGLIGAGYSHEFIYHFNNKVFSDLPVTSVDSLHTFLDRFDFKEKQYEVYVAVEKHALEFKTILEKRLKMLFVEPEYASDLKYDTQKFVIARIEVTALDEKSAANHAYEILELFFRYYKFLGDQTGDWLLNKGKVINEQGEVSFVNLKPTGFSLLTHADKMELGETSEVLITELLSKARCAFDTVDRAVDIHNVAIAENNLKNGFLNLWSIFEILFVSERTESKSGEIESKVLPILQKDYISASFSELYEYITDNISNDLSDLKKMVGDEKMWFQKFVLLPEYSDVRASAYELLNDYPLIRSRISYLNDKYSSKAGMLSDIERHSQRLKWHLKRLYRTRNAIIHSGDTPHSVKELGEHLHSYVDQCLLEVICMLASEEGLCTIDNVVIDSKVQIELIIKHLKGKDKINKEDIDFLFDERYKHTQSNLI